MWVATSVASALENIRVGSTTRTIISYAPADLPRQAPLIIALHGANQDAPYLQGLAKFESVADTAKFVVVYANGVNRYWDLSGTSDIQFMEAIIDSMYSRHHINRQRVYLTGFSMGGMFTYFAANRMADKIAAFAPVSGYPMGGPNASSTRPVPILHTHGTGDDVCVYGPAQSHVEAWAKFNGCDLIPEVTKPYPANKPSSPASMKRYRNGRNGVEVALLTLADKGHWWSMDEAQALTSVEVWNFCKRYSLGAPDPEIERIEPENCSFDLLPSVHNRFEVVYSDSVNRDDLSASLIAPDGRSIALLAKGDDRGLTMAFELPADAEVTDGEYQLQVSARVTDFRSTTQSFTYAYGVVEVSEHLNVDTLYCPDFGASREEVGEGIPAGWRRINATSAGKNEITTGVAPNVAGVRLKYFEPGGDFDAGFYLSARDNTSCRLYYGATSDERLHLPSGRYSISFRSAYWSDGALSANASYNFSLLTTAATPIFSAPSLRSSATMSEKTDRRVVGSRAYDFGVSIKSEGDYILSFEMTEGWNSVVLGGFCVTTMPTLADRYKGGLLRVLSAARRAMDDYEAGDATAALQSVVDEYAGFVSNSPSAYQKATAAVENAIIAFDKADKVSTGIEALRRADVLHPSAVTDLMGRSLMLPASSLRSGLYIVDGHKIIVR